MPGSTNRVGAVDRTFEILEIIQEFNGATVSDIEAEVDIGMSGVHSHLSTLVDRGYVVQDGNEYDIGLRFLGLGAYARDQMGIYNAARPEIGTLAEKTGELTSLITVRDGLGVYIHQMMGENAVELDTHLGKEVHLHCTALGKALLGFRPPEEVDEILDTHGMPRKTDNTITDRNELMDELEEVREQQYAVDREERLVGLRCIAAPITDTDNRSVAAISVSCPVHRSSDERFHEELPDEVLGTANLIEIKRNYS